MRLREIVVAMFFESGKPKFNEAIHYVRVR